MTNNILQFNTLCQAISDGSTNLQAANDESFQGYWESQYQIPAYKRRRSGAVQQALTQQIAPLANFTTKTQCPLTSLGKSVKPLKVFYKMTEKSHAKAEHQRLLLSGRMEDVCLMLECMNKEFQ